MCCTAVGFQSIFYSNYDNVHGFEGKPHIYSDIQKVYRVFIDKTVYGIDTNTLKRQQQQEQEANKKKEKEEARLLQNIIDKSLSSSSSNNNNINNNK